jgi:phosphotransferase system IIA component
MMGFGVVAQDHSRRVMVALCDTRPLLFDSEGAELLAVRNVVELCQHMGLERVCLKGDALVVVQSL